MYASVEVLFARTLMIISPITNEYLFANGYFLTSLSIFVETKKLEYWSSFLLSSISIKQSNASYDGLKSVLSEALNMTSQEYTRQCQS